MRDTYHGFFTTPALDYVSLSDGIDGTIVDTFGFNSCLFVLHVDDVQNADSQHYFVVYLCSSSSPDMSNETRVTAANGLLGSDLVLDSTSYAQHTATLGYVGGDRYVRLKVEEIVISGTAQAHMSAIAVLDHGALQPLNTVGLV